MSRPIVLQRQFQALVHQNQNLRTKAKKINEIQAYVNILMQSSQNYQSQLSQLNSQNRQLKNRIDNLMGQNIRLEKTYQNEFKNMQSEFKRQLIKKQQQIRFLENSRQKDRNMFQQSLNQNQSRCKTDIQRLKLEIYHIQGEYELQIKKLTNTISQRTKQLQVSQQTKNQMKRAYLQESNNLSIQINKLQKAFQQSQHDNFILKQQCSRYSQRLGESTENQSILKRQMNRREQQYLNEKRNFQKLFRSLEDKLNQVTAKEKKTQSNLKQAVTSNENLKRDNIKVYDQNGQFKITIKKLQRLLNEKQQQLKQSILKSQQQQQQFRRLAKRHTDQLNRLQQDLNLSSQRLICQKRNTDSMKGQIQDLIKVIDKLQQSLAEGEHKSKMLNQQNQVLFKQVQNLSKQLKARLQQIDQYEKNFKIMKNDSLMLQQMYHKQSAKAKTLQNQNNQIMIKIQAITKQQKSLQQQQINLLIEKHLQEKRDFLQNNRLEKQNLINKYQQALKDRDEQARKRLQLLEDQISLMRVRH